MSNELNNIGEEAIADMEAFYSGWLETPSEIEALYEAHFYLGLIAWQRKNEVAMQNHFRKASAYAVSLYRNRAASAYSCEDCVSHVFAFLLIFSYAEQQDYEKLAMLPDSIFIDRFPEYRMNYFIRWFKNDLPEFSLDAALILENKLNSAYEENYYIVSAENFIQGVIAILQNDDVKLDEAIFKLHEIHEYEATEGYLKHRFEGLVCLWLTALGRFADRCQKSCRIESKWVPTITTG